MKVASQKHVSFNWWFRMVVQLSIILLGACAESVSFRRDLSGIKNLSSTLPPPPPPVRLNNESRGKVVIDNGIVSLNLSKPGGYIIGIFTGNNINILETENPESQRGYFDVVWNDPGKEGGFQRIHGTNFSVIAENKDIVEVSFVRTWTASLKGKTVPINIDQRYILRSGDSGFYSYVIFHRPPGLPAVEVYQIRNVFKLDHTRFDYMAISNLRQRNMPSLKDRKMGHPLKYPEAVLLSHTSDPQFNGEVDDKYQYSSENRNSLVHGWISRVKSVNSPPQGFWLITPRNEFRSAGPIKQDLTSHVGPTTLAMYTSTHYGGKKVTMVFREDETYKKVFGPVFVYLNSAPNKALFRSLWSDAVNKLSHEVSKWPYDFVGSKDFIPTDQRGTVAGQLLVKDGGEIAQPAQSASVGLAVPGDAGSWQKECKGYQFWTQTDRDGHFLIKNIVPGNYNLYAWVPGFIGDYIYKSKITIIPGSKINLNSLIYNPPRHGPTLWEIGIPDRTAAEFYIPDANPLYRNKLYNNISSEKFRQYGLWERYSQLLPNHDLVYEVGVSDYHKDWFFAQVTRKTEHNSYVPTTWQIKFQLKDIIIGGNYTLQVALASATYSKLEVRFNDPNAESPHFSTGLIGDDNAIARHGIHGLYWLYTILSGSHHFVKGNNTIYLTQSNAVGPFEGVMYDYIRLESPPKTKAI